MASYDSLLTQAGISTTETPTPTSHAWNSGWVRRPWPRSSRTVLPWAASAAGRPSAADPAQLAGPSHPSGRAGHHVDDPARHHDYPPHGHTCASLLFVNDSSMTCQVHEAKLLGWCPRRTLTPEVECFP